MSEQIIGTGYLPTVQGICKIVEFIGSFIAILCVSTTFYGSVITFFEVVTSVSMIISAVLFIAYMSRIVEKILLPWNRFELFFHFIWGMLYFIASALLLFNGYSFSAIIAAGIFGFICVIAHFVDGYESYKKQPLF